LERSPQEWVDIMALVVEMRSGHIFHNNKVMLAFSGMTVLNGLLGICDD